MSRIDDILRAVDKGESALADQLLPEMYQELRQLAASKIAKQAPGQTLQATALVHEVWLRFDSAEQQKWKTRKHFFLTAAKAMTQILIDRARRKLSHRRGAGAEHVEADLVDIQAPAKEETLLLMNDALEEFREIDPDKAEIVSLRFFAGFTEPEIADIFGVSERTVRRSWTFARAWLFNRVKEMRNA